MSKTAPRSTCFRRRQRDGRDRVHPSRVHEEEAGRQDALHTRVVRGRPRDDASGDPRSDDHHSRHQPAQGERPALGGAGVEGGRGGHRGVRRDGVRRGGRGVLGVV